MHSDAQMLLRAAFEVFPHDIDVLCYFLDDLAAVELQQDLQDFGPQTVASDEEELADQLLRLDLRADLRNQPLLGVLSDVV